jgi:hypothetical protein
MRQCVYSWCLAALLLVVPGTALAQRELHWDRLEVVAHLDAAGTLHVAETQTMVFTGDWNGGERRFTLHPRHTLRFTGIARSDGGDWRALTEDSSIDDVDEFAWTDRTTLRWRSRLPSGPPFDGTVIRYELRYELSGILLKDGDQYTLDHDFAFRDRDGPINQFLLRLTLDPAWQSTIDVRDEYAAGPLPPGQTFVLTLPLHYSGAGSPSTLDLTRPPEIVLGVSVVLGMATLGLLWFFVREYTYGRFVPLDTTPIDEAWLREHILEYPAEVVGAAWDEGVGPPEVVALIARMVNDGTLESSVGKKSGKVAPMTLRLKVDRSTLQGHERSLVDGLFFDDRTETSTTLVKAHYRTKGFNPAAVIHRELQEAVAQMLPAGDAPRRIKGLTAAIVLASLGFAVVAWFRGHFEPTSSAILTIALLVVAGIGWAAGLEFRGRLHWGPRQAVACLAPALAIALGVAAYLWFYAGTGRVDLDGMTVLAIVLLAVALTHASITALKSRQRRQGMALRKRLAAGREFFISELRKAQPALRDEWYPWLVAFGLAKQMDDWSAKRPGSTSTTSRSADVTTSHSSTTTSSSSSSSQNWTGFGGGHSGGAGGGASWQAAASSMAAGVSPPSSKGSGGSGGGGGSSGGGSSGGGGGGGW